MSHYQIGYSFELLIVMMVCDFGLDSLSSVKFVILFVCLFVYHRTAP